AGTACAPNGKETLLVQNLAPAVTRGASGRARAGLGARTAATIASFHARYLNLSMDSEDCLFERDFEVVANVFAALGGVATAAASAEEIAEAKKITQDVAEIGECLRVEALGCGALQSGVAVPVVSRALLRIAQNAVGFGGFLEAFLRLRIIGIAIRVKFQ